MSDEVTWLDRFLCWAYGHVPVDRTEEQVAPLTEPGGEPRDVVIRFRTTECSRCGKLLDLCPGGIVRDPA